MKIEKYFFHKKMKKIVKVRNERKSNKFLFEQ